MIITKNNLLKLLKKLKYKIIAPTKAEKDIVFDYVGIDDIIFDFSNTVKPPKEFFFSQREKLLEFSKGKVGSIIDEGKRVLFGIRPCDLKALEVMDHTFKEVVEDPHYLEKRKNTLIIALGCVKLCDPNAFCKSAGAGPIAESGFDIQLIPDGNGYLVETGSEIGEQLVDDNPGLFSSLKNINKEKINKKIEKLKFKDVDLDLFMEKLTKDKFEDKEYWEKVSKTCIRCAGCNYLCPSCFCTNMTDTSKNRIREWDSCMLRGFTREASGEIPREELSVRFRQRIFHKYKWHKERYNVHMCTGCGRCITYCPGLVPYVEIINEVSNEKPL